MLQVLQSPSVQLIWFYRNILLSYKREICRAKYGGTSIRLTYFICLWFVRFEVYMAVRMMMLFWVLASVGVSTNKSTRRQYPEVHYLWFIYDPFCNSDSTVSNDRWLLNNALESLWKEAAVTYFKELSRHLSRGTEESYEKPQSG
jgi:hypothetical protein